MNVDLEFPLVNQMVKAIRSIQETSIEGIVSIISNRRIQNCKDLIFPVAVIDELFIDTSQFLFMVSLEVNDCFNTSLCNFFDVVRIQRVWANDNVGSGKL